MLQLGRAATNETSHADHGRAEENNSDKSNKDAHARTRRRTQRKEEQHSEQPQTDEWVERSTNRPNACARRSLIGSASLGVDGHEAECSTLGGINLNKSNLWLLHAWMIPGWGYKPDGFRPHHPMLMDTPPNP